MDTKHANHAEAMAVYFEPDVEACVERVRARVDHPTIPHGPSIPALLCPKHPHHPATPCLGPRWPGTLSFAP